MDFSQRSSHLQAVLSQNRPYVASLTHKVRMSCVVGLCHLFTRSTMFSDPKISYVAVKYFQSELLNIQFTLQSWFLQLKIAPRQQQLLGGSTFWIRHDLLKKVATCDGSLVPCSRRISERFTSPHCVSPPAAVVQLALRCDTAFLVFKDCQSRLSFLVHRYSFWLGFFFFFLYLVGRMSQARIWHEH